MLARQVPFIHQTPKMIFFLNNSSILLIYTGNWSSDTYESFQELKLKFIESYFPNNVHLKQKRDIYII